MSFDKFKRKMSLNGGSLRSENIANSINLLEETFANDPSVAPGVYFWELGAKSYDDNESLKIRIYKRSFSSANGVNMKFQTLIDSPVIVGDILYDSVSGEYSICTESFNIDGIHWQGKLTLCNWILRWQNKDGDILDYPCYDINTTQYNSGEQANKQFTVGSSQHMLTLPYDDNTVVLKSPKRLFLDRDVASPGSFEVTQNDTTSYKYGKKGLVKVTVTECARNNDTDRADLGICDYIDINKTKQDADNDASKFKSVISHNTFVIKSGGDLQTFTGKFFDENGVEVKTISAKWDIVCGFKDDLQIEESNNDISIGIDSDLCIDEEFKLILSDAAGNYSSSALIRIGALL